MAKLYCRASSMLISTWSRPPIEDITSMRAEPETKKRWRTWRDSVPHRHHPVNGYKEDNGTKIYGPDSNSLAGPRLMRPHLRILSPCGAKMGIFCGSTHWPWRGREFQRQRLIRQMEQFYVIAMANPRVSCRRMRQPRSSTGSSTNEIPC